MQLSDVSFLRSVSQLPGRATFSSRAAKQAVKSAAKRAVKRAALPSLALALCVGLITGCEESKGGFGEAEVKDKSGMLHEPLVETKAPDFKKAFTLDSAFDADKSEVQVTLKLQDGFHAYAKGETIGKPVELAIQPAGGWLLDGTPVVPAGKKKNLGDLGESVILEGDVAISAKVKGGSGDVSATLMVQVCTDTACDRPRPHSITLPTQ